MKGSRVLSIIVFCVMMLSVLLFFPQEAEAQEIDYIQIRDAPGGGGNWIGPGFYILWESYTFYAAGYNSSSGYVEDVFVDWTSDNESVGTVTGNGSSTTFYAVGGGTCVVTADYGGGITNSTGILTVAVLDEIIIRDAPDGGGNPVLNRSYYVGENDTFWVAGYNNTYGYIGDMTWADWWSDNTSVGTISPDGTPGGTPPTVLMDEDFSVSVPPPGWTQEESGEWYQSFTNAAGGTSPEARLSWTTIVGDYAYLDSDTLDTTASSDLELEFKSFIDDYAGGYDCTVYTRANSSDSWTDVTPWTNPISGNVGPATYNVDISSDIGTATQVMFEFDGDYFNIDYWYLDDVKFQEPGTPGGEGSSALFEAVGAGTCVIHVYSGMGMMNETGTITVNAYDVDYIIIRDSPRGGGSPVGNLVYKVGDSDIFYAAGYNFTAGGYIGDVLVNWTSNNESVGTVTTNGSSTMFNAVGIGTCVVTADYGGGITNDTGILTVAAIDYILIRDAPDNGGNEVEDRFYFTWWYEDTFYAAGYNDTHGYLGDVYVTWVSSNPSVGNVTSIGYSTYFDPVGDGTCVVTANYNGTTDETGTITVSSATIDYIQIRDAPDGGGDVVIDPIYILGSVDTYYGALYNYTAGYLCDVPSGEPSGQYSFWNSSKTSVVTVTTHENPATIICSDTNTGTAVITLYAMELTNSTTVTVVNWTIDYISIMDAPGGAGNFVDDKTYGVWDPDTFYAVGFNYTHGYVIEVLASWSSNDTDVGTVTSPGISTTFTAQWVTSDSTCQVNATYDGLSNTTGILTVLAPRADYVQIRSAEGGGGGVISGISYEKGDADTYYGASYNDTVGFIGSVPQISIWESTDTSIVEVTTPGNSSTITCSNTNWGTVTVILNDTLGHTNATTVIVLNCTVDYILIRDAPLGGGADLTDPANYPSYPVGYSTMFYGAMYNNSIGYVGDVASISIWTSSNTNVVEVTCPGASSTITCSDTNWGTVTITLYEWMGYDATTQVTVLEPTIDYMKIMDAPNGMGNEVGDMVYIIGDTDIFYAAAFNNTAGYFKDVSVAWDSDNTSVGTVTTPGVSTNFTAVGRGACFVTADFGGGITDITGTLTVTLPSNITVDDSGGAHFTSIQEAIDAANPGDTVYVYSGTYFEHLTIDKSITLMGEDKDTTIIDGEGYGKVIYVSGDDVSITGFTIQNGEYDIYCDESDSTEITYNKIRDYDYGIYNHKTTNAWIAHNMITDGQYGIVTYEAYNDAIRYNTISYNTVYGAKDYNSQLKNCFNWNYFHHNHIAYYYDPDYPLSTLEFDGNVLEDNYIAIKVENASTISITNNTMSGNDYGIYLIKASPNIANNTISTSNFGIYAEHSSPTISNNKISEISQYGIYAKSGDSLKVINNTVTDTEMIFYDSTIKELWLRGSNIKTFNTTIEDSYLDATSSLEVLWLLSIRVVDEERKPVEGAAVLIHDAYDAVVSTHVTDSKGWIERIPVIESLQDSISTIVYNPYRITVLKGSLANTSELTVNEDTTVTISLQSQEGVIKSTGPAFLWGVVILIGFIGAIGVSGLCIEVMKYGLLTLFLPLYSRIRKRDMLDQPTRERIYGYIIGNPGAYFGLIKEELDLGSGQLVYHLKQLKEAHLIYSREDGVRKRFYPADVPKPKSRIPNLSDIQEKILGIIENNSGIGQKKIASSIGISRQVANYHLTKMERKGLIDKEVVGRESRYYPSENYSV